MSRSSSLTVDDLVALNDEIAALARAGVPLPLGLRALGEDMPGRVGRLATVLSERLEKGQTLEQALRESSSIFSPVYCAVVIAGLRSGRLAAALESLSTSVRRVAETRRAIIAAMVYPLIVLAVASQLFLFSAATTMPVVSFTYERFDLAHPPWYEAVLRISTHARGWVTGCWILLGLLIVVWLVRSARSFSLNKPRWLRLPAMARILRASRLATFAEVMALLVEYDVPLDEAVELAGTASSDAALRRGGEELAEQVRRGGTPQRVPAGIPPFLGYILLTQTRQQRLVESLREAGAAYRRQVVYWGNWLGLYAPILLSAGIGGVVVLAYAISVLAPFYHLLFALS